MGTSNAYLKGAHAEDSNQHAHLIPELGMRSLYSVALSPNGQFVILGSADNTARIWDLAKRRQVRIIAVGTEVKAVAYSPDGKYVVTPNRLGGVILWNAATGVRIRDFRIGQSRIYAVAFSKDGHFILSSEASASKRHFTVEMWEVETGRHVQQFWEDAWYPFKAVAFSCDGHLILTGGDHATLWDADNGKILHVFDGHWGGVNSVAFSPDGKFVLTGGGEDSELMRPPAASSDSQESNPQQPERAYKDALLWDETSGRLIRAFRGHDKYISSVAFSPDGSLVLTGSADASARLWSTSTGQQIHTFKGHSLAVSAVAFSPDGRTAVTGSLDETARLWNVDSGDGLGELKGRSSVTYSVAFSPNGQFFVTGGADNIAYLWSLATGGLVRSFKGHRGWVESVVVSPDSHLVLTGSIDGTAGLWDLATGQLLQTFKSGGGGFLTVAFSPDGNTVATGGYDAIRLWNVRTGKQIQALDTRNTSEFLPRPCRSIAFSPDGMLLVAGYETAGATGGSTLRLWDISSGKNVRKFRDKRGKELPEEGPHFDSNGLLQFQFDFVSYDDTVNAVSFSPDGNYVITGDQDHGHSQVWSVSTGKLMGMFRGYRGLSTGDQVTAVEYSEDGQLGLTADSSMVRVWNPANGKLIRDFGGHTDLITSAKLSPDDKYVLTSSWDGTIRLWEIASGEQTAEMLNYGGDGWVVSDGRGYFDTDDLEEGSPLSWIADDDPARVLGVEVFMRQYFTPRLLPKLLAHETLPQLPGILSLNRIQPQVKIKDLKRDATNQDAVRIIVSVKAITEGGISSGARDLRIFRDGQMIRFIPGDLKDGDYAFDGVTLAHHGPNQQVSVTAYAFNRDLVKSATAERTYTLPASWPERKGRVFLINVGINRTTANSCTLLYAVSDALAMRSALTQRLRLADYQVDSVLLEADNPKPGTGKAGDDLENGASKERLREALAGIAARATPDDLFIFSYSGHGYTDAKGEFYLLPSDLQGDCDHPDEVLRGSAISTEDLTEWIRPIDAGDMVMILDTCYSAASIEGKDFKPAPMGSPGLGQLAFDKHIRVLVASQATQPAGEVGALQMGYLSYALTRDGLDRNKADSQPPDGSIWLHEWLAYAVDRVPNIYSQNIHGNPWTDTPKGVKVNFRGTVSLQTPSLFDFRTDQDHGIVLQKGQWIPRRTGEPVKWGLLLLFPHSF